MNFKHAGSGRRLVTCAVSGSTKTISPGMKLLQRQLCLR